MAVDTAARRFSMLNFWDGTTIHMLFEVDSSVDLDDRQHMLDLYSGIAFAPASTIDGAGTHVLAAQFDSVTLVSDGSNWFIIDEALRRIAA